MIHFYQFFFSESRLLGFSTESINNSLGGTEAVNKNSFEAHLNLEVRKQTIEKHAQQEALDKARGLNPENILKRTEEQGRVVTPTSQVPSAPTERLGFFQRLFNWVWPFLGLNRLFNRTGNLMRQVISQPVATNEMYWRLVQHMTPEQRAQEFRTRRPQGISDEQYQQILSNDEAGLKYIAEQIASIPLETTVKAMIDADSHTEGLDDGLRTDNGPLGGLRTISRMTLHLLPSLTVGPTFFFRTREMLEGEQIRITDRLEVRPDGSTRPFAHMIADVSRLGRIFSRSGMTDYSQYIHSLADYLRSRGITSLTTSQLLDNAQTQEKSRRAATT